LMVTTLTGTELGLQACCGCLIQGARNVILRPCS
jgi:hypothetical protein